MTANREHRFVLTLALLLGLSLSLPACQSPGDDDSADDDDSAGADDDQDGWITPDDCDDARPETYPGATELCDALDNNCDGAPAEFEQDGDGDGQMDCMALVWGIRALAYSHYIEMVDALLEIIFTRASEGCPTETEATAAATFTAIDGVEVSTVQEELTITGDCSSSSAEFTGSLLLSSYQEPYAPASPIWNGELRGLNLSSSGFGLSGTGSTAERLLLSGSVSGVEDIRLAADGGDNASEWGGITLALELELDGIDAGIPEFLHGRTTQLQLQQTHNLDTCHLEQSCDFEEETFTSTGSASLTTSSGNWTAETVGLSWLYRFETPAPGKAEVRTGCYFEPGTGEIHVTAPGATPGSEPWTARIVFDGDEVCDGCGEITIGQTTIGSWCGLAPLEEDS